MPDSSELPDTEPDVAEDTESPQHPVWPRAVIFGAAALVLLFAGATLGMLLTMAREDVPPPSPGAGSVEVGFAQDMSAHHLQAVTMANWARDHSENPAVEQFAFDIASTQLEQVGRMKGWLMMWHQPEEPLGEYMTWMSVLGGHGHGQGHGHGAAAQPAPGDAPMPGMATNDELAKLRSLSGQELDVYFLQLMLRHHQGGVEMAEYARDHTSVSAVRTLAISMLTSQGAEMDLMRQMLADRGAAPLPYP